jgi:solute carrier family 40 (iron-regulated transporter), member 1
VPLLENKIGVIRAGTWNILFVSIPRRSEVDALVPVLLSFYIGTPKDGERGPAWNSAMLFTGLFPPPLFFFSDAIAM